MNPLPRFFAMALFVVLAALVVWLGMAVARGTPGHETSAQGPATTGRASPASARAAMLSQRVALGLAAVAVALAAGLILSLAIGSPRRPETKTPFPSVRTELSALAKLAETSVAQGQELSRERDVRRRAEEDASLKQQLLTQSLDEKIRLGRNLHDGIIQSLYAAGLTLETVRALVKSNPDEAEQRLDQTRASLNNAIRDVRAYIVGLAPENLRRAGFGHALRSLLTDLGAARDAQFDINIDDEAAALLSPEQSIETLQIAREAVSNALRHGGATVVTLRMHKGDREVCLLVQDNGRGFNAEQSREGGHGLGNMRARAEKLGASLRVISRPGEGARVLATLPILQPTPA